MALSSCFTPTGLTKELYDDVVRGLNAAGAGWPAGRTHHVALESNGLRSRCSNVWESQEAFEAFGATLVPIMTELGVDPGQPMVAPVHNLIEG